jgi:exodeoxyribonuclease-5
LRKGALNPAQMLRGGQLICGKNATRFQLNNDMRHAAGFRNGILPSGPDEKIICLKNQNDLGLINGMFLSLADVVDDGEKHFSAVVTDDEGRIIGGEDKNGKAKRQRIYKGHFLDHLHFDKGRHDQDWKAKKMLTEATFGWAITCHKAQGSQWENVLVWDDGLGRTPEDRNRWLYTAITRAEKGLVLLA